MATSFGQNILSVFDVWEDSLSFLAEILESGKTPDDETRYLFNQSLIGHAEDWYYLIDCARSIQRAQDRQPESLDGVDVLSFVWEIFNGCGGTTASPEPWEETDRLIALAKDLERDIEISPPSLPASQQFKESAPSQVRPRVKRQRLGLKSHYWTDKPLTLTHEGNDGQHKTSGHGPCNQAKAHQEAIHADVIAVSPPVTSSLDTQPLNILSSLDCSRLNNLRQPSSLCKLEKKEKTPQGKRLFKSPYFFQQPSSPSKEPLRKRPPPGTISCIPFPPLDSPSFGIIQEELAHNSFWLLIAITFLIKTSGQLALPAFRRVRERFPSPSQLLDPSIAGELLDMIRHLGLSKVRLAYIQKYAKAFIERPPKAGVRYRVKNYDKRAMSPPLRDPSSGDSEDPERSPLLADGGDQDLEAWEIGHMTQGKYAIDSWRIFCRDELLGRAEDWNGKGRESEFQPEWMRVKPADKELRACLRWMWMREGWEWDPATGERTILREEMRRAVNEGRVEYDDTGALRILAALSDGAGMKRAGGI
ncbi:methyl- -binding domain-containing 4 [Trichoderma arundinaceum]|uniref:Methyl--binding domain-containing 4 n=1 Tax=Trichoderma arundinaceum TaxID=490622 RepID=A0A395ND94_TRIAR|nr:methyl- -binding domain-containing 4 [Trichoderma arundinaceum]